MHHQHCIESLSALETPHQHWSQAVLGFQPAVAAPAAVAPGEEIGLFDFSEDEDSNDCTPSTPTAKATHPSFLVIPGLTVHHPPQTTWTDASGVVHKSYKYPTPKQPSPIIIHCTPSPALPRRKRALSSPEADEPAAKRVRARDTGEDDEQGVFESDEESESDKDEVISYAALHRWGAVDWHKFDDIPASSTGDTERHQTDQVMGLGLPDIFTTNTFSFSNQYCDTARDDASLRDVQVEAGSDDDDEDMGSANYLFDFPKPNPALPSSTLRQPRSLSSLKADPIPDFHQHILARAANYPRPFDTRPREVLQDSQRSERQAFTEGLFKALLAPGSATLV